jgi:hypothetical protein
MASQAICLALGLWIFDRFVVSSAQWAAEKEVWTDLSFRAEDAIAAVRQLRVSDGDSGTQDAQQAQELLNSIQSSHKFGLLLVNSKWQVIQTAADDHDSAAQWGPERVGWKAYSAAENSAWGPIRGTLQTPQGPRLALAYELKDRQGYALSYRLAETIPLSATSILQSMQSASLIAFAWTCGLQCIVAYLILSRVDVEHSRKQMKLGEESLQRTRDLERTRDAVIFGLAKLAESRDPDTGYHLERISLYSTRLTSELRRSAKFRDQITPAFVRLIGISSALHDIGKVGIEDSILLKPGKLSSDERFRMQFHANIGGKCLKQIEQRLGNSNFLEMAREIALYLTRPQTALLRMTGN